MFDFFISISKFNSLNLEKIKKFFMIFNEDGIKFDNYIFWDIKSNELTWDRYYNGEELVEIKMTQVSIDSVIKLLDKKYLTEFTMNVNELPEMIVNITPCDNLSYEISFSLDSELLTEKDENMIKLLTEKLIVIFAPNFLVSGIEESVLTIDENNFDSSNNVYEFYSSDLNLKKKVKKFQLNRLKYGILFTNKEFFSNINK